MCLPQPEPLERVDEHRAALRVLGALALEEAARARLLEPRGGGVLHRRVRAEHDARRRGERGADERARADEPADAPARRGEELCRAREREEGKGRGRGERE